MLWITLTVVLTIIGIVAMMVSRGMRGSEEGQIVGWVPKVLVVVELILTMTFSAHVIEAGHVGVVYQFGSILGQIPEGLQLTTPWQDVKVASIQVQRHPFDKIEAFSIETQNVYVKATLNYSVSAEAIQYLYRAVGQSWFDVLIEPRVLNFFKEESVRYSAVDIAPKREEIRRNTRDHLTHELAPYSITVNDLLIDNIWFDDAFTKAIESKQIATQDALREQERVAQKRHEAEQVVETARGEANAIRERANGQADANRALQASISDELVRYLAIQKLSDKISVMFVPSGGNMILDPTSILKNQDAGSTQTAPQQPGPQGR